MIPNATTEQLASQHRIEQRAADLLTHGLKPESTFEMDAIAAAATKLTDTGRPCLMYVGALLQAVHDDQDPHHPLSDAGEAAYDVAAIVLGLEPRDPS